MSMKTQDFTIKVVRFTPRDRRLGRHVVHDSRSLRYRAREGDPSKLISVRHNIHTPITDQGQLGSCTGHAGTGAMGADAFWPQSNRLLDKLDATACGDFAVQLYSSATRLDPWPGQYTPDDTGSDGLSVAKALQALGLVAGYQHATTLAAALTALAERPVIVGTSWLSGMEEPGSDGRLNVSGSVEGGHEYVLDELDVEQQRVWMRNSWSESWGDQGRAWMAWSDLQRLLADDGDCTILVPASEPAPKPEPAPGPAPEPPAPQPSPLQPEDGLLAVALDRFIDSKGCPTYVRKAGEAWLKVHHP